MITIFNKGEEIICVDADGSFDQLVKGKTYIALGHCPDGCCVNVGMPWYWLEKRFRRPLTSEDKNVIQIRTKLPEAKWRKIYS